MRITRRAFLGGMAVAAGAAAAPVVLASRTRGAGGDAPAGAMLRVSRGATASNHERAAERRGAWLLVACLDPDERERLAEDLEAAVASEQARRHPLLLDLADERPEDILRELAPRVLPAWTAARSLAAARWPVPGTDVTVAPVVSAPVRPDDVPACDDGAAERDPWLARVRFAAWPLTRAVRVSAGDVGAVRRLAAALRTEAARRVGELGLVVGASPRPATEVAERWQRLGRQAAAAELDGPLADLARGLAEGPPDQLLPPWLGLGPTDLWVVPRLGALAAGGLREEVRRALWAAGGGDFSVGDGPANLPDPTCVPAKTSNPT